MVFVTVVHHQQVLRVQNVFCWRLVDHPGYVTSLLGEGREGGRGDWSIFLGGALAAAVVVVCCF